MVLGNVNSYLKPREGANASNEDIEFTKSHPTALLKLANLNLNVLQNLYQTKLQSSHQSEQQRGHVASSVECYMKQHEQFASSVECYMKLAT
ncbi:unnamed protein product [Linum trigynum]|uniref:Uncharacterized protein n=1 Tax=Linum trigynum TaxID=586398 RepID=A0AAV2G003_9ROSI